MLCHHDVKNLKLKKNIASNDFYFRQSMVSIYVTLLMREKLAIFTDEFVKGEKSLSSFNWVSSFCALTGFSFVNKELINEAPSI